MATNNGSECLAPNDGWADRVLDRLETRYLNNNGLLATCLDFDGGANDWTPLIADFGDVLPFMKHFGRADFVLGQINGAYPHLSHALFRRNGRIRLFENHDWLLGLLELYAVTGDEKLLTLAHRGARTLLDRYWIDDFLTDGDIDWRKPREWFGAANPFNGGYIELFIELYELTRDENLLVASQKLASRWARTSGYIQHRVFERQFAVRLPVLETLLARRSAMRALLFKDNTNFVWGLLALARQIPSDPPVAMIRGWIDGFERAYLNEGAVWLWLDRDWHGREISLKAAFSSIDLMVDIHAAGLDDRALELALRIADRWLDFAWADGRFPERPGIDRDHLDANVDMAVALIKLAGPSGRLDLVEAASRAARSLISIHETEHGLCLAANQNGHVVDSRIFVKYQGLALKLAITPTDPQELWRNHSLLALLRDR